MDISSLILPKEMLDHFKTLSVLELCDILTKEHILEVHLEENNQLPSGYLFSEYESKGLFFFKRSLEDLFPFRQNTGNGILI